MPTSGAPRAVTAAALTESVIGLSCAGGSFFAGGAGRTLRDTLSGLMAARAAALVAGFFVPGLLVAGCAGPTSMGGFSDREAGVTPVAPTAADVCTVRTGLLVIEVERIVVNEYPHHDAASSHQQQPLLLRSIFSEGQSEKDAEVQAWVSPQRYRPGEPVTSFAALRLLERPLRAMTAKRIVIRLAENDRTSPARWNHLADAAGDAASAGGALGAPGVPSAVVEAGLQLLAKVDRDDLILEWATDAGSLIDGLGRVRVPGTAPAARALRFSLVTPRRTPDGMPAATADIVVYRQPEPGCP